MAEDVSSIIKYYVVRGFLNFHKKLLDGVYLCGLLMLFRLGLLDVWVAVRFLMYHKHWLPTVVLETCV